MPPKKPHPSQINEAQRAQDYKDVFNSPQGRRVLADLMAAARVYTPIYSDNPIMLAYHSGERNLALRIATYLAYRPDEFVERAIETTRELEDYFQTAQRSSIN